MNRRRSAAQRLIATASCVVASFAAPASECVRNIPQVNPSDAFIDHADGTVTDSRVGLMWKRCSEGQTWNGATCDDSASSLSWAAALEQANASEHAGHSDWRLPNIRELRSLVEECRVEPAINVELFPDTPSAGYWSASPSIEHVRLAWYVDFNLGSPHGSENRMSPHHARLVRDASPSAGTAEPVEEAAVEDADQPADPGPRD